MRAHYIHQLERFYTFVFVVRYDEDDRQYAATYGGTQGGDVDDNATFTERHLSPQVGVARQERKASDRIAGDGALDTSGGTTGGASSGSVRTANAVADVVDRIQSLLQGAVSAVGTVGVGMGDQPVASGPPAAATTTTSTPSATISSAASDAISHPRCAAGFPLLQPASGALEGGTCRGGSGCGGGGSAAKGPECFGSVQRRRVLLQERLAAVPAMVDAIVFANTLPMYLAGEEKACPPIQGSGRVGEGTDSAALPLPLPLPLPLKEGEGGSPSIADTAVRANAEMMFATLRWKYNAPSYPFEHPAAAAVATPSPPASV